MDETFISIDIEADGPIPGDYSMLSLGACLVSDPSHTFYCELKPISDTFDVEALAVSHLDRVKLAQVGTDPTLAMTQFNNWINSACGGKKPVFVAFNAPFDWMFVHWYFVHFVGKNPFGSSALDVKAYYMGKMNKKSWYQTSKKNLEPEFQLEKPLSHNALEDAQDQAKLFTKMFNKSV